MSARSPLAASMSEDQLQEHVRALCADLGLAVQHIHDPRRCWLPGWPDLVILGRGGIAYRELKSEQGSLTPDQRRVGSIITKAGGSWCVWRPRDLVSGVIQRQLTVLASLQGELWTG